MDSPQHAAVLVATSRQIKKALTSLREANQEVAKARAGLDIYASQRVTSARDLEAAQELLKAAYEDFGTAEVVIVVAPHPSKPHGARRNP